MMSLRKILAVQKLMGQTDSFSYVQDDKTKPYALHGESGNRSGRDQDDSFRIGINYYTDPVSGDERIVLT